MIPALPTGTPTPVPSPPRSLADLLPAVLAIGDAAAQAILKVYATDFSVDEKADSSPLTEADRAAHDIISAGLRRLTHDIPVLSEESPAGDHDYATRRHWPELWLVDPLDGTREFVKRNGEFTVNIALIRRNRPVLGIVLAPALDLAYGGAEGLGAWRRQHGETRVIAVHRPARHRPVVAGSRSHRGASLDAWLARLGDHELKSVGSALKLCLVAEGSVDVYPRLGDTSEWDIAAGQAVLEAAGGVVVDLSGNPLRYNEREGLLNPHFMACGDPAREWWRL
jgi:3'(2'), 5'-bisphosphate nucleotidase